MNGGSDIRISPELTRRIVQMEPVSLPTLGGTALEVKPGICFADGSCQTSAPMPPVPLGAWTCFCLGLGVLVWAAWRGRETSAPPRAPVGGFRSQPHDDVMLVEVA